MSKNITLGYLGYKFQTELINQILHPANKKFADRIMGILHAKYFDNEYFRLIISTLKDYHEKFEKVPTWDTLETILRMDIKDKVTSDYVFSLLKEIKDLPVEDWEFVQEKALNFCRQQELKKANEKITKIIQDGDFDSYEQCSEILKDALSVGAEKDDGTSITDNIEEVLEKNFRDPIPTGVRGIDDITGGGLARGELGCVIAPLGVGKAQPLHSKLLTPNGWTTMGEIKVGDMVVSEDGNPTKVIGVYPQGVRPIYNIRTTKGNTNACLEHLWKVIINGSFSTTIKTTSELIELIEKGNKIHIPHLINNTLNYHPLEDISYTKDEEAQCIMVDSDSHLYVTDDYIVTHNTTMLTKIANTAYNTGHNVLQIVFEDLEPVIKRKHFACWTGVDLSELDSDENKEQVLSVVREKTQNKTNDLIIRKFPSEGTTINHIKTYVRHLISTGFKPDVIILDYIDVLESTKHSESGWEGEGSITRGFENLVYENQMVGWFATQGNRFSISSELVTGDQMGGSIKKAQIAHFIVSVAKTLPQKESKRANIAILKSRFGKDGIVYENCIYDNGKIIIDTETSDTFLGYENQKEEEKEQKAIERIKRARELREKK
jgi:replicative DNA helicase